MSLTLESIGFTAQPRNSSRFIHDYYRNLRNQGQTHREAREATVLAYRPRGNAWKSKTLRAEFNNFINLAIL